MKRIVCFLISLPLILTAYAENLTLEQCTGMARDNYPSIARYGIIERVAQYDLANASKAWLPHGTVSGQATWQNAVAAWPEQFAAMLSQLGMEFPGIDKTQYKIGIDISQQIWDGGMTSANRRAIESSAEVDRRAIDVQMYDVEGRVQDIYFGILLLDGRISSTVMSIELVDSTLRQVRAMHRNGVAMQSDCDQIEARLLVLQQQKSQLASARDGYQRVLEIFIGEPIGERALILPGQAPESNYAGPQIRLFDAQIENVVSRESGIKASVMPQIGAFASGYYGYPGFDMFKNMQTHDPAFNFMAGVKVSWNFGALYTRSNSLSKLRLQRRLIESDRLTFLFNNRIAEAEASARISSMREVMRNDQRIVELRRSVVRAARSQLLNGVIDATSLLAKITDVELAENDLILHNIELTKAIYNLNHIQNK